MSKTRYILHRYYLGEKKKVFAEKKINKKGFCSRKSSYFYFIVWLLHLADKRGGGDGGSSKRLPPFSFSFKL